MENRSFSGMAAFTDHGLWGLVWNVVGEPTTPVFAFDFLPEPRQDEEGLTASRMKRGRNL